MKSKKLSYVRKDKTYELWRKLCIILCVLVVFRSTSFIFVSQVAKRTSLESKEEKDITVRLRGPLEAEDPRLVSLLRTRYLSPPSPGPYNLSTNPEYNQAKHGGSWPLINDEITKLFSNYSRGFFIEAGALDGEVLSNTLWLEQKMGWSGLLLEPNPKSYRDLASKRRKAWISQSCLSPESYPKEHIMVSLVRQQREEPKVERVVRDHIGSSHLLGIKLDNMKYNSMFALSDRSYSVVQCFPLITFLLALKVTTVDLLSLDIQGAEKNVLQNFPWDNSTLNIRVIVVEIVHHETMDQDFVNYMSSKNYKLVFFGVEDYIFVREGDPILKKVDKILILVDKN